MRQLIEAKSYTYNIQAKKHPPLNALFIGGSII